jgi:hypothetical protein
MYFPNSPATLLRRVQYLIFKNAHISLSVSPSSAIPINTSACLAVGGLVGLCARPRRSGLAFMTSRTASKTLKSLDLTMVLFFIIVLHFKKA